MKTYNWGIISTGKIAGKFVEGLKSIPRANVYAVASRDLSKAQAFATKFNIGKTYGSYQEMINDPKVDIVYIGTPNNLHYQDTMMCLEAGKATLCEKPFALNTTELNEMVSLARSKNVFLMEALWTMFLPSISKVQELIQEGHIGTPHMIKADFGFKAQYDPHGRLFNPELGGGSLLDIGIYPIFLSKLLLGKPLSTTVSSIKAPTGVDLTNGIIFTHEGGKMSILSSTFAVNLETEAQIVGDEGTITLHRMFHMPTRVTLSKDGVQKEIAIDYIGNGYNYEAEEVMKCLNEGKTESSKLPLDFSLELMEILMDVKKRTF